MLTSLGIILWGNGTEWRFLLLLNDIPLSKPYRTFQNLKWAKGMRMYMRQVNVVWIQLAPITKKRTADQSAIEAPKMIALEIERPGEYRLVSIFDSTD